MRMDVNSFYTLLAKVEPYIRKQDTHFRQSISAEVGSNSQVFSFWVLIYIAAVYHEDIKAEFVSNYTGDL